MVRITTVNRSALRVTLFYAVFAGLWILLSDYMLGLLVSDPHLMTMIAMYKGWFFVTVTAFLLFSMLKIEFFYRQQAAQSIYESEVKFKRVAESTSAAIVIFEGSNVRYMNEGVERLTGFSQEELREGTGHAQEFRRLLDKWASQDNDGRKNEFRIQTKSGDERWAEFLGSVIRYDDTTAKIATIFDVTERKKVEEHIRLSLFEKELLLKEIHHRVKNNMQVISSLLSLQSQYVKDEGHRELFRESQNRVRSMALVHERLYRSGNLGGIDYGTYLHELTSGLVRSYSAHNVSVDIDCTDIKLGIDTAIPCGLIIHELVANALKYAFPSQVPGTIRIALQPQGDDFLLKISDDGIGLPPTVNLHEPVTLGLQLVVTLVEQLDGTFLHDPVPGTSYTITLKDQKRS